MNVVPSQYRQLKVTSREQPDDVIMPDDVTITVNPRITPRTAIHRSIFVFVLFYSILDLVWKMKMEISSKETGDKVLLMPEAALLITTILFLSALISPPVYLGRGDLGKINTCFLNNKR